MIPTWGATAGEMGLYNGMTFASDLTHSLVARIAYGDGTPTFTRATTKTFTDNEGVLRTAPSGCAAFEGARRVYNQWSVASEPTSSAGYHTATNVTFDNGISGFAGSAYFADASVSRALRPLANSATLNRTWLVSFYVQRDDGGVPDLNGHDDLTLTLDGSDILSGVTVTLVSGTLYRATKKWTPTSSQEVILRKYAGGFNNNNPIRVTGFQLEDITGRADQTTPSEYVSVGALDYRSEKDPLYLSLPGTGGNNTTTPSATANQFTGNIDFDFYLSKADWTPAGAEVICSKLKTAGQYSYDVYQVAGGSLQFRYSTDGTVLKTAQSTAIPAFADGAFGWIRVTLDTATGDVKFYTGTDGDAWTQLGTTRTTTAGAIFAGTDLLDIGLGVGPYGAMNIGRARFYSGFRDAGGTLKQEFYPHRDAVTPTGTITSSTTGEVWTINGASSVVRNVTYHGAGADGCKFFDTDLDGNPLPTQYTYDAVSLNGVAGTYVSTPDSVAASITGDIDIRVKAALTDWTPALIQPLISKYPSAGNNSYVFYINSGSNGQVRFAYSPDGTTGRDAVASVTNTFTDGSTQWLRVTYASATGKVNFYTSTDGSSWSALGVEQSLTAGSIYDGTGAVEVGSYGGGTAANGNGKIYEAQIYNGINGTLAVDFDASRYAGGSTLTGSTGETWTLQGNAKIHPTNSPNTGITIHAAATNLCLQSNAFTTTPWANLGSPTFSQNQTGPNGQANYAWTITDAEAGQTSSPYEVITASAGVTYTWSAKIKKEASKTSFAAISLRHNVASTLISAGIVDQVNGTIYGIPTGGVFVTPVAVTIDSFNDDFWIASVTAVQAGATLQVYGAVHPAYSTDGTTFSAAAQGSAVFCDTQLETGSVATPYIATTTTSATRNLDRESTPTASNVVAAASSVYLEYTPDHTPSGTVYLWGTYVDASNSTAILHDGTNLIMRKRIAGTNYDATIANAFTAGTTYKALGTWGAGGVTITLNGTEGTPHANTTAAQIGSTMELGGDGNGASQPGMAFRNERIIQRQLSAAERGAITQ